MSLPTLRPGPRIYRLTADLPDTGAAAARAAHAAAMHFDWICVPAEALAGAAPDTTADARLPALVTAAAEQGLRVMLERVAPEPGAPPADWLTAMSRDAARGVGGFLWRAAHRVAPEQWRQAIAAGREQPEALLLVAESLGAGAGAAVGLAGAGFDYVLDSLGWWDGTTGWLYSEHRALRPAVGTVSCPVPCPPASAALPDLAEPGLLEAWLRQRYVLAAAWGEGLIVTEGYEDGRLPGALPAGEDVDLRELIAGVNRAKSAVAALNGRGAQRPLDVAAPAAGVLRFADASGAGGCTVTLLNPSATEAVSIQLDTLVAQIEGTYDRYLELYPGNGSGELAAPEQLTLPPLGIALLQGDYASAVDHAARLEEESGVSRDVIRGIVGADYEDPFAVRGMHRLASGALVVRAFVPDADRVEVVDAGDGSRVGTLKRLHPSGFFAGSLGKRRDKFPYRLRATWGEHTEELEDPYRFPPVLGEMDVYLLAEGTHRRSWDRLGAHPHTEEGVAGTRFAVWAPNARRVAVVGDFNAWDGRRHPMRLRHGSGVWELFVPGVAPGARYKYEIKGARGELLPLKSDPYAFAAEMPPQTASVVAARQGEDWGDGPWMEGRAVRHERDAPISIYEVHLASWQRPGDGRRYLDYDELADRLVPYVVDMGFTHLELLPVSEYPFDGSWGYQPIGLFAPTSRFGSPAGFRRFVDRCHQAGIGLLLDWVPGHFPSDPHGLGYFDGTHLYEHADPRQGFHQDWNTLIYNYGRNEVASFLINNALFWLDEYHVDGLRVDAVASMLYLDYSRKEGEWVPNRYGSNENLEAIDLLRRFNETAYGQHPGSFTVAEESTSWSGVSRPAYLGGLGFGYKWNMGWMHDTLEYMAKDPVHRRFHHQQMTFGLVYAFSENFVLPLSHDEVVHGKGSLLTRMPGDRWQKFANLRAYYGFMWTHPGKKLLFMGGEIAQEREWNHDTALDWHLLEDPFHGGVSRLVRDLNRLYRELPALHRRDCEPTGFEWVEGADADQSILAYLRQGEAGDPPVLVVSNFTPRPREGYRVGVPLAGRWAERLNTDATVYGGSGVGNAGGVASESRPWHYRPHSLTITVPPLATVIFEHQGG